MRWRSTDWTDFFIWNTSDHGAPVETKKKYIYTEIDLWLACSPICSTQRGITAKSSWKSSVLGGRVDGGLFTASYPEFPETTADCRRVICARFARLCPPSNLSTAETLCMNFLLCAALSRIHDRGLHWGGWKKQNCPGSQWGLNRCGLWVRTNWKN